MKSNFEPLVLTSRRRPYALAALTGLLLLLLLPAGAIAETLVVNDFGDNPGQCVLSNGVLQKGCTLRAAIEVFNKKHGQTNTIVLPAGDYTLKNTIRITGDGPIGDQTHLVTIPPYKREEGPIIGIRGAGAGLTVIHGACGGANKKSLSGGVFASSDFEAKFEDCGSYGFPMFVVRRASLSFENVTIRDGLETSHYGTIVNFYGDLSLRSSTLTHNSGVMAVVF